MASDPDWIARGIAAGGLALSAGNIAWTRWDSRWKKRKNTTGALHEALDDLVVPVENWRDAKIVMAVFSPTAGSALQDIRQELGKIPDRRLCRWLRSFTDQLQAARGAPLALDPVTQEKILTRTHRDKLKAAEQLLKKIRRRLDAATRRGSG